MSDTVPPGGAEPDRVDPRPKPQYGEYAPPGWVSPVPVEPAGEPKLDLTTLPPPRPDSMSSALLRPTPAWDRTLTIALLVVGLFGAYTGWQTGGSLGEVITVGLEPYGIQPGTLPSWLDAAGTAIALSHALLYLAAVGLSISLLARGRRAAWAPLAAGIIAGIIFWSVLITAFAPYAAQVQA